MKYVGSIPLFATCFWFSVMGLSYAQEPIPSDFGTKSNWSLIAADAQGFFTIDATGSRVRQLESAAPIESVAYDRVKEVVWFASGNRLWALDLRAGDYRPVLIATDLPVAEFEISGWSNVSAGLEDYEGAGRHNLDLCRYPIIVLQPEPRVEVGEAGDADRAESAAPPAAIKRVKLVGSDWLRAHSLRPDAASRTKVPGPRRWPLPKGDAYGCEEASLCGSSSKLGRTGLELIIANHGCGDSCHTGCLLYDPISKRFASPADGVWSRRPDPTPCEVELTPDDSQYLVGRSQCQVVNRAVSCREHNDVNPLGWFATRPAPAPVPDSAPGETTTPENYVQDMISAARIFDRGTFKAAVRSNDPWVERFLPPDELWRVYVTCPESQVPRGSQNRRLWEVLQRNVVDRELVRVDPPKRTRALRIGDTLNYRVGDSLYQCRVMRDFRRVEVELFVRDLSGKVRDTDWWLYDFGGRYYFQDE